MKQRDRLHPQPWHADYLQLRALRAQINSSLRARWPLQAGISVLDLGCSNKPYEPLIARYAGRLVGVDIEPGPRVDIVASADRLPLDSETFDCVLCTQVLQYVPKPSQAVAEMRRILKPGGLLLLSTHGASFVDRRGGDRWRWTQYGLQDVLDQAGTWSSVEILPAGGVMTAAAYLLAGQVEFAAHRLGIRLMGAPVCLALNVAAWHLDRATRRLRPAQLPDAVVNYLVVATRSPA
jgi:SAM-dependent methyltransferase